MDARPVRREACVVGDLQTGVDGVGDACLVGVLADERERPQTMTEPSVPHESLEELAGAPQVQRREPSIPILEDLA